MEQKKPTNAQLQSKIKNAIVLVPKDKETKSIIFSDKGVRYTVTDDYAVISTNFHSHVFDKVTANGYSRPYLYTKQFVDMALENDCTVKMEDGSIRYSYKKLFDVLKEKEDKTEYNIATYFDWWSSVIFDGLYSISEDAVSSWLVYFKYINFLATNSILLEEHKEDVTNKQFVEQFISRIKEFTDNVDEHILFHALSDEERMKQEIEAIQENEQEELYKQ